jgi:tetratricopeptide (TPR) repeat protein
VKAGPKGFEIETVRREEVRLTAQLREHLGGVGTVDLAEVRPRGMRDDHLHGLSESLAILQFTAEEKAEGGYSPAPSAQLELARAALAEQAWDHAAGLLERYTRTRPEDWEAQYARGVAHANSRIGRDADIRALQAYSDAISFLPRAHAKTWLSRLYAYRGGMLKRLCRYEEALNDLRLARHLASDGDDRNDISYNFACVYAMSGDTGAALREVRSLIDTPYIEAIAAHRHDYFASLADNSEFQAIVGVHSPTDATR